MARFNTRAWITQNEAGCLAKYAKKASGDIVEVGTFRGGGTEILRQNCPARHVVWSVDLYVHPEGENPKKVHEHLEGYDDVFLVVGDSSKVGKRWGKPISLLVIDADHTYEGTKADFEAFSPCVSSRGVLILHDAANSGKSYQVLLGDRAISAGACMGVVQFRKELERNRKWKLIETVDTMAVFQRKS